jgi:hypothetical protein
MYLCVWAGTREAGAGTGASGRPHHVTPYTTASNGIAKLLRAIKEKDKARSGTSRGFVYEGERGVCSQHGRTA